MRVIDHLKSLGHSNRQAQALLQTGKVWFCGIPIADATRDIDPGDIVIRPNAPRIRPGHDPAVLFSDPHLAVVYKPAGMLSVAAPKRGKDDNLVSFMARIFGCALPVHRLDEPTSGVMMIARTPAAQRGLKDALAVHDIERRYVAIVWGRPSKEAFTISNALVEDRGDGRRGAGGGPHAKRATTHFEVLRHLDAHRTLMGARLETGRTHQVRIHLSEHGLPVLGDERYAPRAVAQSAPRLALHACRLGFRHPITNAPVHIQIPLPDDMARLCRKASLPSPDTDSRRRPAKRSASRRRRKR